MAALSIGAGLNQLKVIARYCSDSQIISQVEEIIENYHCMLSFLAGGGKDEERSLTQERINKKALEILRVVHRDIRLQEVNDKYSKAFHDLQNQFEEEPEEVLLKKWGANLLPDEQLTIQDQLFCLIWTSALWNQKQTARWYEFISRQTDFVKIHLLGAVTLSLWEYLDTEKMAFLFLFTDTESEKLNALTITALVLLAEKYQKELSFYPELHKRYQNSNVNRFFAEVIKERLLIHQTLIAIKKEQEEMANFSLNMSQAEMESLMSRKMANVRYMVEKGLDINLGNRTELWNKCQFLRENISHWWLPFEKSSPVVEELLLDKDGNFNKQTYQFLDLPSECDIDRYAMFSFLAKNQHKNALLEQIAQSLNLSELTEDGNLVPYTNHLKNAMQNLFRIFVHSPIRKETDNPFAWPYIFWQNDIFKEHLTEQDAITLCSEMTDTKIYDQPVAWIDKLAETSGTSLAMLHIKSKCLFQMQEYQKAIASLTQMLFMDEENEWALSLIQKCYDKIGRKDKQLEHILRLLEIKPEETAYLTSAAVVLIEMEKYEEALKYLFHLDFIDTGNPLYMASIEICAIHLRKFDLALRYNSSILEIADYKDKYHEYLNAGHIHFIMGDWKKALVSYRQFRAETELQNKAGRKEINADKEFLSSTKILKEMGIGLSDIQLMRDMIQL